MDKINSYLSMPELPEVETISRQMNRALKGSTIQEVRVYFGRKNSPRKKKFIEVLTGRKILSVERRAKVILVKLSGGYTMAVHLKMTGRLLLKKANSDRTKHTHVVFKLSGNRELHWEDFRKFGWIKVLDKSEFDQWLSDQHFGPEPLKRGFNEKKFAACLRTRPNATIKQTLMVPQCIAGIGNIYVAEALWVAKIHPLTKISALGDNDMKRLYNAIIKILKLAIPAGGTSADANWQNLYGQPGRYVNQLKVYGRDNQPCLRCQTRLCKIKIGGRGTTYCPSCQKK